MSAKTRTIVLLAACNIVAFALLIALAYREGQHFASYGVFNAAEVTVAQPSTEDVLGPVCEFGYPNDLAAQNECYVRLSLKRLREDDERLDELMSEQQAREILPLTK